MTSGKSFDLEKKLRHLEQSAKNRFGGATDSELSDLEDVVALTAHRVQSTESEVGDEALLRILLSRLSTQQGCAVWTEKHTVNCRFPRTIVAYRDA
jgi:hypothetical protein